MELKTAVILAGGRGLRLRPYTESIPKPMIEISGKPLLEWIINWYQNYRLGKNMRSYTESEIARFVRGSSDSLTESTAARHPSR